MQRHERAGLETGSGDVSVMCPPLPSVTFQIMLSHPSNAGSQ